MGSDYPVQHAYPFLGGFWNRFTLWARKTAEAAISAVAPSADAMDVFWQGYGTAATPLSRMMKKGFVGVGGCRVSPVNVVVPECVPIGRRRDQALTVSAEYSS